MAALHELITTVGEAGRFELEYFMSAHRALMVDDPEEADYAGRIRDMQNWIGGSDHSALVSAVLRRRGVTKNAVAPLASGLLARRDDYFGALGSYRLGDPAPLILLFAQSARVAATASRVTIAKLNAMPDEWRAEIKPRSGSIAETLIDAFYEHPVMSVHEIHAVASGATRSQAYRVIDRLVDAGFLEEITGRKKDRVWAASEVLAELDDLDRRIQDAMNAEQ